MARNAAGISVRLSAGVGELLYDLEKGNAGIRNFSQKAKFNMAESSAAIKVLEGNFGNSQRAVARFLSVTLGLGPAISAAFNVIGPVLLAKAIYDVASKLQDFFKDLAQAPEKMRSAFRDLNAPMAETNAQLDVTNAKLENQLAKLTGRRENTLKETLAEAVVEAQKLSNALDKDLKSLEALLKQESHGEFAQLFGASGAAKEAHKFLFEGEGGTESIKQQADEINDLAIAEIQAANKTKDADRAKNAETQRDIDLNKLRTQVVSRANAEIAKAQARGAPRLGLQSGAPAPAGAFGMAPMVKTMVPGDDPNKVVTEINTWKGVIKKWDELVETLPGRAKEKTLKSGIAVAEADEEAKRRAAPWKNMLESLITNARDAKRELDAVGLDEAGRLAAKSYSEAAKAIDRVNKEQKEQKAQKGGGEIDQQKRNMVEMMKLATDQTKAMEAFRASERDALRTTTERIAATEMLTAAIGKGYEANKAAVVEGQLMGEYKEKYNAPEYKPDVDAARIRLTSEFEARHRYEIAQTVDKLNDEIALEIKLAEAITKDAWAVKQVEFAEKQRQAAEKGASAEVLALNLLDFAMKRQNEVKASIELTNTEIAAVKKLAAARAQGLEAEFRAQTEVKHAEVKKTTGSDTLADQAVDLMKAKHEKEISDRVQSSLLLYQDRLETLKMEEDELKKVAVTAQNRADVERVTRDLLNERLKILSEEALAQRSAEAGVRAFFLDMQADAKSSGQIVYEALHSALDRTSSEFAKLFTRQHTDFRKLFGGIGETIIQESIKSSMQKGLGALGKKIFGADFGGKRGDTPTMPMYVWNVNGAGGAAGSLSQIIIPQSGGSGGGGLNLGRIFGGSAGGGIFNFLGHLFGGGRAAGGDVSPGSAYTVGERGVELFTPRSAGSITSNAAMRSSGMGASVHYHVDARGQDPAVIQNLYRALEVVHRNAVGTSILAVQDLARRRPAQA